MCAQGWALSVKMFMPGLNRLGSSMLPAMMMKRPGIPEEPPNRREPHSGQKPRREILPLSAVVMIGDGKDDLAAARAAGCRFVGVGTAFAQCRGFDGISLPTLCELPAAIARDFNEL